MRSIRLIPRDPVRDPFTSSRRRRPALRFACEPLPCRVLLSSGDPDLTFSGDGRTTVTFPGAAFTILDTAIQSDGKIVLAGRKGPNAAVARLNVDGTVDTTFGGGGLFEYGGIAVDLAEARAVAVAADGRIVVGGFCLPGIHGTRFTVGQLTANGARDTSFGNGLGIVRSEVDEGTDVEDSLVNDLAIQVDGKIIAAGRSIQEVTASHESDMVVVRYNANGAQDTSFADGDGTAVIEIGEYQTARAVTIDYTDNFETNPRWGTIVVAGDHQDHFEAPQTNFVVARLRDNGTADSTFDGDGRLVSPSLSAHGIEIPNGVAVQPGGKIVVGGTTGSTSDPNAREFIIARYRVNGPLDTTFGADGNGASEVDLGGNDRAESMAVNYQGGLVLGGTTNGRFALAAFDAGGRLDPVFSGDGVLTTDIPGSALGLAASARALAPLRRLVVAGGNQVARFIDVGSIITVGTGDPFAAEQGQEPAHFFVRRDKPLPFRERIFLNVGGTARPPSALNADWFGTNIEVVPPLSGPSFVEILSGETFGHVTVTPFDDTNPEGDETVVFTLAAQSTYDIGAAPTTTLAIEDNDLTGGPTVTSSAFLFETAPQRLRFTFNQNVASSISAADFQVSGPAGIPSSTFAYDAVTNTATLSFGATLPDGTYTARAIAAGITNAAGQPMAADHVLEFFFLNGDANRDGRVNLADFNILASNFGGTNRTFSQGDFTYDGNVNLQDFNILASRFGTSVGPETAMGGMARSGGREEDGLGELLA